MPGTLPTLKLDSTRTAQLATVAQARTSVPPAGESFHSKLDKAQKSEKPKPAETNAARSKKSEKGAKTKSTKAVKKHKSDEEQEDGSDSTASDSPVEAAKDSTQQEQGHDSSPDQDAEQKPESSKDANTPTVNTPTLVVPQHIVAPTPSQTIAKAASQSQSTQPVQTLQLRAAKPAPQANKVTGDAKAASQDATKQGDGTDDSTGDPQADGQDASGGQAAPVSPFLKSPKAEHTLRAENSASADPSKDSDTPQSSSSPTTAFSDILASFDTVQSFTDSISADEPAAQTKAGTTDPTTPVVADPLTGQTPAKADATAVRAANAPESPQASFNADNHPKIVQSVQTTLLPNGGTMKIRLDPPELGVLQVSVHVKDGVTTASFETSNDQATKLLSHSMGQLKQALEAQGVTVGKMHVQQTPKGQSANNQQAKDEKNDSRQQPQDDAARQEQQRKEAMQRMWRKLAVGSDPLDLVA